MFASAIVIPFPSTTRRKTCFTAPERDAITMIAESISPRFGVSFDITETGHEAASIGPGSGGADTCDIYGITCTESGEVELLNLDDVREVEVHQTLTLALRSMLATALGCQLANIAE